jgi:8-oxo-dGTP pyrophosphatase MutT (NUDIX family)
MMPAVTVLMFDDGGRLLLAQERETGLWMTIGGAIDPNERPADAAVREVWEETGLLVEPIRVTGVFGGPEFCVTYANHDVVSYTTIVFEARVIGGRAQPDGEEAVSLSYVSEQDASALAMAPWTRVLVAEAFKWSDAAVFAPPTWSPPRL